MKPLSSLTSAEARALRGMVFDLDDTVLDHGALGLAAYGALFDLRASGLKLIACTGRPAGWGELVLRQWPIDAAIAENGAVALMRSPAAAGTPAGIHSVDGCGRIERARRLASLRAIASNLCARFPEVALADDNLTRQTDVTLDIGEFRHVRAEVIHELASAAEQAGVRTFLSSVHLHLTYEAADKASGSLSLLAQHFGEDERSAAAHYGFVGDSTNDAPAFAAFGTTFGVANVRAVLDRLPVPPVYIASRPMGEGFAEVASALILRRK